MHDDLIAELRALSDHLDVPAPADQRAAVRVRLAAAPAKKSRRWKIWLISALVAAVGATGAIAPARAAVLDLLRVACVEVSTRPAPTTLPATPSPLPSLHSAAMDEARRVARFPLRFPSTLGTPEQVTLADQDAAGSPRVVTATYRNGKIRYDQFDGTLDVVFLKQAPTAQWEDVNGGVGIWVPTPHPVTYVDREGVTRTATARLSGPTLIWQQAAVTFRLEGYTDLDEALAAARSIG
jgi:hypothetical protein